LHQTWRTLVSIFQVENVLLSFRTDGEITVFVVFNLHLHIDSENATAIQECMNCSFFLCRVFLNVNLINRMANVGSVFAAHFVSLARHDRKVRK